MRIRAAVVRTHGVPPAIVDLELDDPRPGEILVRLIASGVCARDVEAIAGDIGVPRPPFVPGCEGAGIVEKVGEGIEGLEAGTAVVIVPNRLRPDEASVARSGGAPPLRDGDEPVSGFFFGQSSFATHMLCDAESIVPVGEDAPLELLAALGREVLLGAGLMLRALGDAGGATVVVTGADATGLGACMAAAAAGARTVVLADPRESRRALALEIGATVAVPADEGLAAVVRSLDAGGATVALETSGGQAARAGCEASLAAGGTCVIAEQKAFTDLDAGRLVSRLAASHAEGRLPLERIVGFFPFERIEDALAALANGEMAKPVVRFSLGAFDALDRALQEGAAADAPEGRPVDQPETVEPPKVVA